MSATKWSNQRRRARNGYAQRAHGPLTRAQKAALCILCRAAYEACGGAPLTGFALDDWRHDQVSAAVGKPGLTACLQDDYQAIRAHFLELAGETGQAMSAHVAHQTEDIRIARHKLAQALHSSNLPEAYAAAIARRQYKCELHQCNARQVWQLVFTVNSRGSATRADRSAPKKRSSNEPF